MKTYEFTPYYDDYSFTLEQGIDEEGDEYYHGIDIPCKDDPEWRFWSLYEDACIAWDLTNEEIENIKEQATKYCLESSYTFNGKYFEWL